MPDGRYEMHAEASRDQHEQCDRAARLSDELARIEVYVNPSEITAALDRLGLRLKP